jgi:hypothetical protein
MSGSYVLPFSMSILLLALGIVVSFWIRADVQVVGHDADQTAEVLL